MLLRRPHNDDGAVFGWKASRDWRDVCFGVIWSKQPTFHWLCLPLQAALETLEMRSKESFPLRSAGATDSGGDACRQISRWHVQASASDEKAAKAIARSRQPLAR
ncbi:hypothetical protein ON010_g12971 [Phytophthora cinnamomi]|nr:hypothetical protein ON010_g12971 [Phytophthora cinnamomi]